MTRAFYVFHIEWIADCLCIIYYKSRLANDVIKHLVFYDNQDQFIR